MGTPLNTTSITGYDNQSPPATFQNSIPYEFTGTGEVRSSSPTDNYIYLGSTKPSKTFQINGINTLNFKNLTLSFAHHKSIDTASNEMIVEVSDNGKPWQQLTYTRVSGNGTSIWAIVTTTGNIPSSNNLSIRFTNPTNNTTNLSVNFRIDDIKLIGTPIPLDVPKNNISGLKVFPNPAKNILYATTDKHITKEIELFDVLGKSVLSTKIINNTIDISSLSKGIYIAKITEEGKTETRKIVIE